MKKQLFTFLALLITGIVSAQVGIGTTTPTQALDIETNEAGGTAIDINNTGTGDPKINLQLNGTTTFSIGVDNDDADKLKIGTSAPETNTRVTIDNTGNVGVGTATPDQSAVLDAFSTTKGFLPPRLTTTQRNAITNPATGLVVFNTTTGFIEVNVGTTIAPSWQVISPGATGATGAAGAQGPTGLLTAGTTAGNTPYWNGTSWVVNSSNIFNNGGNIGIGTTSPSQILDVESSNATKTTIDVNNTSTGDPTIQFQISGSSKYAIGIDNSDSDKLKISTDTTFASTPAITVDASQNVGVGTSSPNSTLDIQGSMGLKVNSINTSTTLNSTYNVVLASDASGSITITLPPATSNSGKVYYIKKTNSSENTITIDGNASETIDGATTIVLYVQYDAIRIICDGTNWHIIDDERKAHFCSLRKTAATQSIPNGLTTTKVLLTDEDVDVGGIGDPTTNNRINIKRAGNYKIDAYGLIVDLNATGQVVVRVRVNGVNKLYSTNYNGAGSTAWTEANALGVLYLSAGDYVELTIEHNHAAGNRNTHGGLVSLSVMEVR